MQHWEDWISVLDWQYSTLLLRCKNDWHCFALRWRKPRVWLKRSEPSLPLSPEIVRWGVEVENNVDKEIDAAMAWVVHTGRNCSSYTRTTQLSSPQ
mmetsp:Transcript_2157/g.5467  ORF Transcript_2157/g.5467 Transcript_2157/m.5467 type:complete len:96 (-) Transcript_2157:71-358(-)